VIYLYTEFDTLKSCGSLAP